MNAEVGGICYVNCTLLLNMIPLCTTDTIMGPGSKGREGGGVAAARILLILDPS